MDLRKSDASLDAPTDPGIAPGKVTLSERIYRSASGAATADPSAAVASTAGSTGTPLPGDARAKFEASLDTDLSAVRIHTGAASAKAAEGLGARAFATGQDIHFGAGQYRLDDLFGAHLLAHEVAHTVQQRGGGGGPQTKLSVSEPGDAHELEADRAADAMVTGARVTIGGGSAPRVAREAAGGNEKTAPTPVWVEFSRTGEWSGPQVLETLASQITVPEDLKAAILAGPKPTASYCVDLRKRVRTAGAVVAKQAECEQIANALTSRITELTYATSQSPLQYRQLADVARWAGQYTGPTAAPAPASADKVDEAGADKGNQPAEEYATRLVSQPGGRVREGDKDQIRTAAFQNNDEHKGDESGNAALTGWSFLRDPFDNTVTAVRPDGTGLQFTYQVEKAGDDGAPKLTLIRTVELSKLRVGALKRQDKMAPIELQEGADGPQNRKDTDAANGIAARKKFKAEHPGVAEAWEAKMAEWNALDKDEKKKTKPPAPPVGYQANDLSTTLCTATPGDVYHAAGGNAKDGFPFTPPKGWTTWRTLATTPEGPKPGDVYYLWDLTNHRAAHMGVFKSATPVPGGDDLWTWVVTDGGQGGYDKIQQAQERTRGPFSKKTGIFSSSIAEAGQSKGDRRLEGWVDIDAYRAEHP